MFDSSFSIFGFLAVFVVVLLLIAAFINARNMFKEHFGD